MKLNTFILLFVHKIKAFYDHEKNMCGSIPMGRHA